MQNLKQQVINQIKERAEVIAKELELEIIDIFDYNGDIIFCLAFKENDDSLYIMKALADSEDTFDPVTDEEYDMINEVIDQFYEDQAAELENEEN